MVGIKVLGDSADADWPSREAPDGLASLLSVRTDDNPARRKLSWSWLRGEATAASIVIEQDYTLCVYDASGAPQPLVQIETGGGTCGQFSCWKHFGDQAIYIRSGRNARRPPTGLLPGER